MQDSRRSSFFAQAHLRLPNMAVTVVEAEAEASTVAGVMVAAFTAVADSVAVTMVEVTDTAVADLEG